MSDLLVAGAFVAVGQVVTWGRLDEPVAFAGPRAVNAGLNLLLMAALAWRRSAPLAALGVAVAVYYLPQPVVRHDVTLLAGFVPLIVLTASAGYHCSRRGAVLAVGTGLAGLATVSLATPWLRAPSAFAYNAVFLVAPWLAARGLREREDRAAALGEALAAERLARDAALVDAVASERARLAREMHDIVAHSVSVMVIQVGAARLHLAPAAAAAQPGAAAASLLAAEDVGRQTLADLRRLLQILRADEADEPAGPDDPAAPQPDLAGLDELIGRLRAAGLQVDLRTEGTPVEVPAGLALTVYRIVQEALTNVLRHSRSRRATVRLAHRDGSLLVEVTDGDPGAAPEPGTGHGLVGIAERVSLFGGTCTVGPLPGGRWRVRAELPVAPSEAAGGPAPAPEPAAAATLR